MERSGGLHPPVEPDETAHQRNPETPGDAPSQDRPMVEAPFPTPLGSSGDPSHGIDRGRIPLPTMGNCDVGQPSEDVTLPPVLRTGDEFPDCAFVRERRGPAVDPVRWRRRRRRPCHRPTLRTQRGPSAPTPQADLRVDQIEAVSKVHRPTVRGRCDTRGAQRAMAGTLRSKGRRTTPRSVTMALINRAGVTSNAGL